MAGLPADGLVALLTGGFAGGLALGLEATQQVYRFFGERLFCGRQLLSDKPRAGCHRIKQA